MDPKDTIKGIPGSTKVTPRTPLKWRPGYPQSDKKFQPKYLQSIPRAYPKGPQSTLKVTTEYLQMNPEYILSIIVALSHMTSFNVISCNVMLFDAK